MTQQSPLITSKPPINSPVNPAATPPSKRRIEAALRAINRSDFVACKHENLIRGHSIPAQDTLRSLLGVLDLPASPRILQVGAGPGYVCAVLSRLGGQVTAIEKSASLTKTAVEKIRKLKLNNVTIFSGDGNKGAPEESPFDIIVLSTARIIDKSVLLSQLTPSGQLVCLEDTGEALLTIVKYTKSDGGECIRTEHGFLNLAQSNGEILIELGIINEKVLTEARRLANANKTLLIDEVRKLTGIDELELYRSLSQQYNLALGSVDDLLKRVDPTLFGSFSKAFLDHQHLIPLYVDHNSLKVVTTNPDASMEGIHQVLPQYKIEKILVTPPDYRRIWTALDICLRARTSPPTIDTHPEQSDRDQDILGMERPELEAHLIFIYEALLLEAVADQASDIHLEQYNEVVRVRLRVDGELRDLDHYDITPRELRGLVNVIKLRAELDISERRLPQGGRSSLRAGDTRYDLRIQVQPSLHGEHVVIRLLPQNSELISIDKLGMSQAIATNYERLLRNPSGLVLVVGPTGSGKTTTLNAGLQLLAEDTARKVITVEDPIEYSINNVQQTRVRPDIGFTFADAMRSFVRQDPDVILVGEIRDRETALEAIRASQTGHLVLSTLHSNDAVDAMQRIYDLGVQPNSLASELLVVLAQKLAQRICPHCREEAKPEDEILAEVFPDGVPNSFKTYRGKGCKHCRKSGNRGRVAVVEYLHINAELRNAISRQIPISDLRKLALDCGLLTMRDSALDHVIQGNIAFSELPRILPAERMAPEARWQWEQTS